MPSFAQTNEEPMDSVEFSLLTCSPHTEVYTIYGHTAIRYYDKTTGEDWAFNYGMFSFKKPFFALRFLFGITDYELGAIPYNIFKEEYRKENRQVVEQVLNLTADEKRKLYHALSENYLPQNRTYRYNFIDANCTTRARDIIEHCINGKIEYTGFEDVKASYRDVLHEHSLGFPWIEFGNDICLGLRADLDRNERELQFLPLRLSYDFNRAQIYANGIYRPLVKEQRVAVEAGVMVMEESFPLSPKACSLILFTAIAAICFIEYKRKATFKYLDITLAVLTGIAGILMLALFCSQHPTTSTNLQILVFNPINLAFIHKIFKGGRNIYWQLSLLLLIVFIMMGYYQDYADGMIFLALSLLLRCCINLKLSQKATKG